jgi:hypothetical protein
VRPHSKALPRFLDSFLFTFVFRLHFLRHISKNKRTLLLYCTHRFFTAYSKTPVLSPQSTIAMDTASTPSAMHMCPEQIKQDIAVLQTTLTTLTTDIDGDIAGATAQELLKECIATCKRLAANVQYVDSLLIAIQERAELEHLRREHERRCQDAQLDDVQKVLDEIKIKLSGMDISPKGMSEGHIKKPVRFGRLGLAYQEARQGSRRAINALRSTKSKDKQEESAEIQKHAD